MTGLGTIPMTVRAMKAGALEFLTTPIEEDELFAAVRIALNLDRARLTQERGMEDLRKRLALLTPREFEVMQLVIGGLKNKQLAGALETSEITAKVPHLPNGSRSTLAWQDGEARRTVSLRGSTRGNPPLSLNA